MTNATRALAVALAVVSVGSVSGCRSMLHNLQLHRLQHLNRQSPLGRSEANFSVSDPIPELTGRGETRIEDRGSTIED